MGRLGIGDRLNASSRQGVIFTDEYRKVKLDPRTLIPSERNKYAQRYSEEQDKIDRETNKKLKQQSDSEKMERLPSDAAAGQKAHSIRLASRSFNEVASGKKPFELCKNDRGFKVGDILEMLEFKEGKNTGRIIQAEITYLLEEHTGLEDGYCILGICVKKVDAEKNDIPGQMSIEGLQ